VDYRTGAAEETGLATGLSTCTPHGRAGTASIVQAPRPRLDACWGGRTIVICHFDWLPLPGNVVEATEQRILAHNPGWGLAGENGTYIR
jgi:hypothetical protein